MQKTKLLILIIFALSIIGMIDAGYLTYEKLTSSGVACGQGFDCNAVLNSKWASVGGIPLSAFGLIFYVMVWFVAVSMLAGADFSVFGKWIAKRLGWGKKNPLNFITASEVLLVLAGFGFLFSLYLVFLMGVVIKAWCLFCLISALTTTSIFLMTVLYWVVLPKEEGDDYGSPVFLKAVAFYKIKFLYKHVLKKIFFSFDAENVHDFMTKSGKLLGKSSFSRWITSLLFSFQSPKLVQKIDGIEFKNPVGLSAGFDYNGELTQILPSVGFGWHTIGTVTIEPYEGNTKPRLGRFPKSQALLVNKGFKSLGAKKVIKNLEKLQKENSGKAFQIPVGISVGSTNRPFKNEREQIDNILECFKLFEKSKVGHSYYELNISCPNTFGGLPFYEPARLRRLLLAVDKLRIKIPIYIKMPIDQGEKETLAMLEVIDPHNIQGVIFGNLTKDHKNPAVESGDRAQWADMTGNLSGKPTWSRSNKHIKLTKEHYFDRFTIIGTGGIFTGRDAEKKMELGADLVQLITGMIFEGPQAVGGICGWVGRR